MLKNTPPVKKKAISIRRGESEHITVASWEPVLRVRRCTATKQLNNDEQHLGNSFLSTVFSLLGGSTFKR